MAIPVPRRLPLALSAAMLVAGTLMAGCAAPSTSGSTSGSTSAGEGDSFEKILAEAPVAAAADLSAGSPMAKIHGAGALEVGGVQTSALFSLQDPTTGKLTGFDAYLSQMLAKYLTGKPDVKLTVVTSQTREQVLENGTVDAVFATYTITPARAQRIAFAGPYYSSPLAIGVTKDNTAVKGVADLAGKDVCVQGNSTAIAAVTKTAPQAKQLLLNTNNECLEALRQHRVQAYVVDQALLLSAAIKGHDLSVLPLGDNQVADPYGIGLSKDKPELKAFVNTWLRTIVDKGLWARVWKLSVGKELQGEPPAPPTIGSVPGT